MWTNSPKKATPPEYESNRGLKERRRGAGRAPTVTTAAPTRWSTTGRGARTALVSAGRLKTKAWRSVRGVMREPEESTKGLDRIVGLKREGGVAIRKGRRRPDSRSLLSWRGCETAMIRRAPAWKKTPAFAEPGSRRGRPTRPPDSQAYRARGAAAPRVWKGAATPRL